MLDMTPVRKIKNTRRSISGFYMFQGVEQTQFESTLERDFLIRHEYQGDIVGIVSQPCTIKYVHPNGRTYNYTPDYLVMHKVGNKRFSEYQKPLLVEVKPTKELREHLTEWRPKFKAAMRYAKSHGYVFKIYDESRIRDVTYRNIRFLARYKGREYDSGDVDMVMETVNNMGSATVDYLLAKCFNGMYRAEGIGVIWSLVAEKKLLCDFHEPLSNTTLLWEKHSND
ncbi:MAG TPA: heteromeric transposase endonuclease subunit TnsA [Glaciecola sp.]|nr:heteromeric transposase endonuclease subunit TnsA [Glaciecola sp.]